MPKIGKSAPEFACETLGPQGIVELPWEEIHGEAILVLLFDSLSNADSAVDDLASVLMRVSEFERLGARVAMVCRDDAYEVQAALARIGDDEQTARIPILLDREGRVASLFGLNAFDGEALWGHCIIDPYGLVRQFSQSDVRIGIDVNELLRCVEAIARPNTEWPC